MGTSLMVVVSFLFRRLRAPLFPMVLYTINHRCSPEGCRPLFPPLPEYFLTASQ